MSDTKPIKPNRTRIYLACPYSHPDAFFRHRRFEAVNKAAADLLKTGNIVFSPISHTHPVALAADLPLGWNFWCDFDRSFLEWCDEVVVLCLPGWTESTGVMNEIAIARELCRPVRFIEPKL